MRRILVDNQLPAALARWLVNKGCDAVHVLDLNMGQSSDESIWLHAANISGAIITKDEDFAQMTLIRVEPVAVVWLRVGNCRTAELLHTLERTWPVIKQHLEEGARLIEIN